MALTETRTITEITSLPLENNIQVKWRYAIEKDGEVISTKDHYKLFTADQKADFLNEVENGQQFVTAMGW